MLLVPRGPGRREAIERWYRRTARAEAAPRLDARGAGARRELGAALDPRPAHALGSCSPSGAIALNWRLLLGPEDVFDYVVWHEACHLVVMDHSARFWALLERHVPGYREPRDWLRRNGAALAL